MSPTPPLPPRLRAAAAAFVLMLMVAACASRGDQFADRSVEELYNAAMDDLVAGNYEGAALNFDEVERQHPYSVWATRAQLMAAFAHYQDNAYDEAILAAQRYIELHPGADDADYAQYLIALSYYEQIVDVGRDQRITQLAMQALQDIIRRYPQSEYAQDARLKLDLARDHLAGKEMEVGRYYLDQNQYLAAINRFRRVVDDYQTTTHVPEALHRLVESYLALGVHQEAQAAGAVLGYNYPGSEWYADSYALLVGEGLQPDQQPTLVRRVIRKVF